MSKPFRALNCSDCNAEEHLSSELNITVSIQVDLHEYAPYQNLNEKRWMHA